MSQQTSVPNYTPEPFQLDPILLASTLPSRPPSAMDPDYFVIELTTPIGRFMNISVDKPRAVQSRDGKINPPKYNISLAIAPQNSKGDYLLSQIAQAINFIADAKWPHIELADPQTGQIIQVLGSQYFGPDRERLQLNYPLRDGNAKYSTDPKRHAAYRGLWFFNATMWPATRSGVMQSPVCLNNRGQRCQPHEISALFRPGCYGRAVLRVKAFEYKENNRVMSRGVNIEFTGVQHAYPGDAIGFDRSQFAVDALAEAGEIPMMDPPNTATPSQVPGWPSPELVWNAGPAGGTQALPQQAPAGYAAPPQPQPGSGGFVPPNQNPQAYPRPMARPPGT